MTEQKELICRLLHELREFSEQYSKVDDPNHPKQQWIFRKKFSEELKKKYGKLIKELLLYPKRTGRPLIVIVLNHPIIKTIEVWYGMIVEVEEERIIYEIYDKFFGREIMLPAPVRRKVKEKKWVRWGLRIGYIMNGRTIVKSFNLGNYSDFYKALDLISSLIKDGT